MHTDPRGPAAPLRSGSRWSCRKEDERLRSFLDQGNRTKSSKLQIALEFPPAPVNGAGTQNTESERKDKQHLPVALPSRGIVTCMTLTTLHLICLGPASAINMQSKQIVPSKERAVILDWFVFVDIIY